VSRRTVLAIIGSTILLVGAVFGAARRDGSLLGAADGPDGQSTSVEQRIDINTAPERLLSKLPGLGPEAVERIVQHRPYRKLDELITKKVLGRKQFARIKHRIRIGQTVAGSAPRTSIVND
jgi:DNA uptake protein ComE-like DNA-binding protein